jgi:hypothetical protein
MRTGVLSIEDGAEDGAGAKSDAATMVCGPICSTRAYRTIPRVNACVVTQTGPMKMCGKDDKDELYGVGKG